jgi:uncharacterized protein YqgV (UPF0045/DUF77 family)
MQVSCQFSLYPLGVEELGPAIYTALAAMADQGLEVRTGPMSSTVTGSAEEVFAGLARAFTTSSGALVMVATISNACPTG